MAGRGQQTFKKRQKEQQRKERQQEKMAKRLAPKQHRPEEPSDDQSLIEANLPETNPAEVKVQQ